jgi:WD40 repeat protein
VTCLSLSVVKDPATGSAVDAIYAGCWDKSIWMYKLPQDSPATTSSTKPTPFPAHADFVKTVAIAVTPSKETILVSGGADGDLCFWTLDGQSIGTLKPQRRGIECIALDPFSPPAAPVIMFSTSQRDVFQFQLPADGISPNTVKMVPLPEAHATSVYKLHFDSDGDLWTASADKTCKRLVRDNGWAVDTTLHHPDFVRDVITHDEYGLVLTACRDEEVRVWGKAGQLRHVFTGHFEEVTGLALCGNLLISVSIDATLRRWSLAPQDLKKAIEEAKAPDNTETNPEPKTDLGMLTAEVEAELRALMENEEADLLERMAADEQ